MICRDDSETDSRRRQDCRDRTGRRRRSRRGRARQGSRLGYGGQSGRRPQRRGADQGLCETAAERARRLPHVQCRGRRSLCRQGVEPEETRDELRAGARPLQPHHADDRADGGDGIRHHAHRDRGAAARGEPDQAAAPALQRVDARRQVVSLYPAHRRPRGAGHFQASRRAIEKGRLFRPVRVGGRGRAHDQRAAARLPAAHLHRQRLREPDAAVPALPDQALFRSVHRGNLHRGLCRTGRRGQGVPVGAQPGDPVGDVEDDAAGGRKSRFRTRRRLSRPHRRPDGDPEPPGHQSADRRRGRRLRHPAAGRHDLHPGVLLPHRPELGQPRLFPEGRYGAGSRRGARRVHLAVLRQQACAEARPHLGNGRRGGSAGRGAVTEGGAQGRGVETAARRTARPDGPCAGQREGSARTAARRNIVACKADGRRGRGAAAHARAAAHRGLSTTRTSWAPTPSAR